MKFTKVVKAEEDIRIQLTEDLTEKVFDCVSDCITYNVDYKNLPKNDILLAVQIAFGKIQTGLQKIVK